MSQDIAQVLNLWKKQYSDHVKTFTPYQAIEQFKTFSSLFTPGHSYFYIINFHNLQLEYLHPSVEDVTGLAVKDVTMERLLQTVTEENRQSLLKKEETIKNFLSNKIGLENIRDYKMLYTYQLKHPTKGVRTILIQNTILSQTEDYNLKHVLGVHTDVTHLNISMQDNISFINLNGGTSYHNIKSDTGTCTKFHSSKENLSGELQLTKREKDVVRHLAQGLTTDAIAKILNLSSHTVRTHRKNILQKNNCTNTAELIAQCLIEGVVV
ncbi:helix-turn-helix transcriptional regulator [Mangrovimonas aestuarii]|uniref:helix-turn-helix transcriptional regulator n=1 Tax=Mangrovimonas aestuarii TaxID=3018443 RepID=UPI002378E651|nr:helix-turn-helix transcriptional regulator [Mangrovimonas aestuarii]